jgi:hypothetical protein
MYEGSGGRPGLAQVVKERLEETGHTDVDLCGFLYPVKRYQRLT